MKRLIALLLTLIMALSLCACGGNDSQNTLNSSSETDSNSSENNLTLEELKSIIAVKRVMEYLNDTLRDPNSVSILEISAVKDPDSDYHIVRIDYNADNGMGGKNRDDFYIETSNGGLGDNTEYFGNDAEKNLRRGNNKTLYDKYISEGMEEVEIDIDTVMNNLDLTEDELRDMVWAITDKGENENTEEIFLD